MKRSQHESALAVSIAARGLPAPTREYRFMPPRLWRFDFAWPEYRVAVEVDGGQWIHGRHNTGSGFERDAEKFLAAMLDGWRVLRVTPRLIKTGAAVQALAWLLRQEGAMSDDTDPTNVPGGLLVHVDQERGRVLLTLCPDHEVKVQGEREAQMLVVQVAFDAHRALALAEAIRAAGMMVLRPAGKGPQ